MASSTGHEWFKLSTALKHYLVAVRKLPGEEAFAFVNTDFWQKMPDYDISMDEENRRQWESFRIDLPSGPGGQLTIGTFIKFATDHGYQSTTSSTGKDAGIEPAGEFVYLEDLKRFYRIPTGQLWDKEQMTNSLGYTTGGDKDQTNRRSSPFSSL